MDIEFRRDPLTVLGLAAGAFLVLAAAGTLAGAPWQYGSTTLGTALQALGALATAAVGVGLGLLVLQRR